MHLTIEEEGDGGGHNCLLSIKSKRIFMQTHNPRSTQLTKLFLLFNLNTDG